MLVERDGSLTDANKDGNADGLPATITLRKILLPGLWSRSHIQTKPEVAPPFVRQQPTCLKGAEEITPQVRP